MQVGSREKREERRPVLGADGVMSADDRQTDRQLELPKTYLASINSDQEEWSKGGKGYKYGREEIAALGVKLHGKGIPTLGLRQIPGDGKNSEI